MARTAKLPNGQIIALEGEAGYQADSLSPGLHMGLWPWQYAIELVPFQVIPQGKVGVVQQISGQGGESKLHRIALPFRLFAQLESLGQAEVHRYQAGADTYREDQLGGLALTTEGLAARDKEENYPSEPLLKEGVSQYKQKRDRQEDESCRGTSPGVRRGGHRCPPDLRWRKARISR